MNIPIGEVHPQQLSRDTRNALCKYARRIIDITPICFTLKPGEVVRLYYYAYPLGGRSVCIQIAPNDTTSFGLCVEVSLQGQSGTIDPKEAETFLSSDAKKLGFTLQGFCKMLEKLSPFEDLAKKERDFQKLIEASR